MSNTKLFTKCEIHTQGQNETASDFAIHLMKRCELIQEERKCVNTPMITSMTSDSNGRKEAMIQWLEDSIEPIKPDSILGLVLMLRNTLNTKRDLSHYTEGNKKFMSYSNRGYQDCIDDMLALFPEVKSFLKDTSISIGEFKRLQEIEKNYIAKCRVFDELRVAYRTLQIEVDKKNEKPTTYIPTKASKIPTLLETLSKSIGTADRYQIKDTEGGSEWRIDSVTEAIYDRVFCTCTKDSLIWSVGQKNDYNPEQLVLIQRDEK